MKTRMKNQQFINPRAARSMPKKKKLLPKRWWSPEHLLLLLLSLSLSLSHTPFSFHSLRSSGCCLLFCMADERSHTLSLSLSLFLCVSDILQMYPKWQSEKMRHIYKPDKCAFVCMSVSVFRSSVLHATLFHAVISNNRISNRSIPHSCCIHITRLNKICDDVYSFRGQA